MARLPDESYFGNLASAQSGRPIASIDQSGYARGAAALAQGVKDIGTGLASAGKDVAVVARQQQAERDKLEWAKAEASYLIGGKQLDDQLAEETEPSSLPERYRPLITKLHGDAAAQINDPQLRELWTVKRSPDLESRLTTAQKRADDLQRDRDVAQVFENLDHIKTIVPTLPPGPARVQWIDTANSLFGALPEGFDRAQLSRSWIEDLAKSSLRSLPPDEAIRILDIAGEAGATGTIVEFIPAGERKSLRNEMDQALVLERFTAQVKLGNDFERRIQEAGRSGVPLFPRTDIDEADFSLSEREALYQQYDKATRELSVMQRAVTRFADPSNVFDPFNAGDRSEVDALYRKLGANPEALTAVFRRTGLVPQSAVASIQDELASGEPARVQAAAESLSAMLERNPDALTGLAGGGEIEDAALAFQHLIDERGLSKEAASAALSELHATSAGDEASGLSTEFSSQSKPPETPGSDLNRPVTARSRVPNIKAPKGGRGGWLTLLAGEFFDWLLRNSTDTQEDQPAPTEPKNPRIATGDARYVERNGARYVALADGSDVFGEVMRDVASTIGRQPGPIRLPEGEHDPATAKGFGEKHVEARHGDEIRNMGYQDAAEFVAEVASGYREIYRAGGNALFLVKPNGYSKIAVIELVSERNEWRVNTAALYRKRFFKNRELLWSRPRQDDSPP